MSSEAQLAANRQNAQQFPRSNCAKIVTQVTLRKMKHRIVGTAVPRKEGASKVTGAAVYADDLVLPGMLHGLTIRGSVPRARIRGIRFLPGVPWDEFTVVSARDIPGQNVVALISDDQPFLASEIVNHPQEPILLLAHPDKNVLARARRLVHIDYDPLPTIFDPVDSLSRRVVIWSDTNVFKEYRMEKGDVDSAFSRAAHIVEAEYSTGAQEQLYIEPNGMIASASPENGVTVWGSMQCPYYVHRALMALFNLPASQIRVVQQETGGAFGGKEEYPSLIAGHAALLAWKSGAPVKLVYDREEDMVSTTKRHPSRTRHRTALDENGRLLALDIEFLIDGGAYSTLSPVVLSRGTIHAAGPYLCENVRVHSLAVATNTPPHGAFRGFGAPQTLFALERHMNKCAGAAGLTPAEFRRRNFLHTGDTTATGQIIDQPLDLDALLSRALSLADYDAKLARFAASNATSLRKKGIGFATFMHGAGFTGSGERHLQSVVELEADTEGRVTILSSMTEMGQGTNTILAQIAAETLAIPYEAIHVPRPDTGQAPNSGPTVASRTAMVVGRLIESAALSLQHELAAHAALPENYIFAEFAAACRFFIAQSGPLRTKAQYQEPPNIHWDDQQYRGDAYGAYSWAVYVAEVTVDILTGTVSIDDFVALQEVGRVLHPVLAAGQIEGGVAQGIGFALFEKASWQNGELANCQMTNYIIPTSVDVPPIRVFFEEIPYAHGAHGAKGIGELPMDGPAPALLNAVENALGLAFDHVPLMPEDILRALATNPEHCRTAA